MASNGNIHTNNTEQTEQIICAVINIYAYTYMYVTTITKEGSYEFEREQMDVWRK